jgi:formylglycine-generating enzyme required for sulfatase activity
MGRAEEEHWNEYLAYDYWISRYPITVAQFQTFVEAGGYKNPTYWSEALRAGVWQPPGQIKGRFDDIPRIEPQDFGSPFNLSNHPVVGITWYEALAFCRWLTEQFGPSSQPLKNQAETMTLGELLTAKGYQVTLPSEAQWEKAARGNDKRLYPWGGNKANPNWANSRPPHLGRDPRYLDLDSTSAVGCFPGGASPYGCQDMAGNVWEWTCSLWGEVKEKLTIEHFIHQPLEFRYPYNPADGREELTAGTHILRAVRGGAFNQLDLTAPCTDREKYSPYRRYKNLGFRVVVAPTSF